MEFRKGWYEFRQRSTAPDGAVEVSYSNWSIPTEKRLRTLKKYLESTLKSLNHTDISIQCKYYEKEPWS